MSKFIILTGLTGCGKTTYAKSLPAKYISYDSHFNYKTRNFNYKSLKATVVPDEDFVMDGIIFEFDPNLENTKNCVAPKQIEIVVLYTTLEHLYDCQRSTPERLAYKNTEGNSKEKDFKIYREVFSEVYRNVINLGLPVKFLYRFQDQYDVKDAEHFIQTIGIKP